MGSYIALTKLVLRLHNIFYKLASKFAVYSEKGLHPKHRLMNYHQFFVDNIKEGDVVLDIGCGNGALAYDLSRKAKRVVAIDMIPANVKIAKDRYGASNVEYIIGDATKYKFLEKFDCIVLSNVLEHLKYRVNFLTKIKDLAPKILIRVPMLNRDWITLYKKELGVEWRLDKNHYTEYTLNSFIRELGKAGLNIKIFSIQFGEIWAVAKF